VRGPASTIRRAEEAAAKAGGSQQLVVFAQIHGNDALKSPGAKEPITVPLELPADLADPERPAMLDREKVTATLHVRAADEEYVMPSMAVRLDVPKGFEDAHHVDFAASVKNVKVIGPKAVIEQMRRPDFAPPPYAQLAVSPNDAGAGPQRKRLRFVDLPEGVRVSDADRAKEFDFEVTRKTGTDS
jgi:hypothetical protein